MSQEDVYVFLENHKDRWYTAREITTALKVPFGRVTTNLTRLRNSGFVDFVLGHPYTYKYKK